MVISAGPMSSGVTGSAVVLVPVSPVLLGRHVTGKMSVSSVTMGSHGSPQAAKKVDRMARVAAAFLGMMGQRMRALRMATMNMHHRAVCTTDAPMSGGGVPRFVCGPLTT